MDARFEGWWTRLSCEACGVVFELEEDVHNGQKVVCEVCNEELEVVGR